MSDMSREDEMGHVMTRARDAFAAVKAAKESKQSIKRPRLQPTQNKHHVAKSCSALFWYWPNR